MKKNRRLRDIVVMAVAVFAVLVAGFFVAGSVLVDSGRYLNNTQVNGVDISGLSKQEALDKLTQGDTDRLSYVDIPVTCNNVTKVFTAADASASTNAQEVYLAALNSVEGAQSMSGKLDELYKMRSGVTVENQITFDRNVLLQSVADFTQQFTKAPEDAYAVFDAETETFTIQPDQSGMQVDVDELTQRIWDQMQTRNNAEINVRAKPVDALLTAAALKGNTQKLGTEITELEDDEDRNTNVDLMCEALNGLELSPNETLSINELTGPRTEEKGYKEAPAIIDGMIAEDFGGGVCQVTSTLYRAALEADCKIVERHHHTWPMKYVPAGLDATIDYNSNMDFKIQNASDYPMFISAKRDGLMLTVSVYGGMARQGVTVDVLCEQLSTTPAPNPEVIYDDTLPKGERVDVQQARDGVKVRIVRNYFKQGELVDSQPVSTDTYRAIGGKYRLGTGASGEDK